jgi:hypothetical protein
MTPVRMSNNDNADRMAALDQSLDRLLLAAKRPSGERRYATRYCISCFRKADVRGLRCGSTPASFVTPNSYSPNRPGQYY